jgi:predicted enzyme related to lactoylglutathione lyase
VAAAAIVEDGRWLGKLHGELRALLGPVFAQARSRLTAFAYISALLAEPGDRRSCWQLAEQAGHATPRRMQALLAEHAWDWAAALAALQRFILACLGDPGAIVVLDETAELKKGDQTVGVARQRAGITGWTSGDRSVRGGTADVRDVVRRAAHTAGMPVRLHHIVVDAHDLPGLARFWTQALGWKVLSERENEIVIGTDQNAPVGMCFMPVTEPKTIKNRVHLDLTSSAADRDQEIDRLLALGARRVDIGQTGAESWTVLADPEGNEFCVVRPKETLIR